MKTKKLCRKCGKLKNIEDFEFTNREKGYTQSYCRKCKGKAAQHKRDSNPEKECLRNKKRWYKRRYGMSLEDYIRMYCSQKKKCKICGKYEAVLSVDHCHNSGVIRGLLCSSCNFGLGNFKDSSDLLLKAANYLKETNTDKSLIFNEKLFTLN